MKIFASMVVFSLAISSALIIAENTYTLNDGKILYVGGDGDGNYSTIQDAISAADDGDTIFVFNGTYKESVYIPKEINLVGESEKGVIIEAGMWGFGINVSCDGVNIEDFSIIHANWENAAVEFFNCNGCSIKNCKIYDNDGSGILLKNAGKNEINLCEIFGSGAGIDIKNAGYNKIKHCFIHENGVAIQIENSAGNEVMGCKISNNSWNGIYLAEAGGSKIHDCMFDINGITISGEAFKDFEQEIYNNSIDGKQIVYLKNESISLSDIDVGEIIAVGCNNFVIENCSADNKDVAMEIAYCRAGHIKNCRLYNGTYGLILYSSSENVVENNIIKYANESGIELQKSNENAIEKNSVVGCQSNGIFLIQSSYNNIYANNVSNNGMGILVFSYSSHNNVSHNSLINNQFYGISIQGGLYNMVEYNNVIGTEKWCGIAITKSWTKYNVIQKNNISGNACGIHLEGVGNLIERNNVYNNGEGIHLSALFSKCKRNIIIHNNFIKNYKDADFEVGTLSLNRWYGNYWDGWDRTSPKPIYGKLIIKFGRYGFGLEIPWINFDFHPSIKPID